MNRRELLGTLGLTTAALFTRLPSALAAGEESVTDAEFTVAAQIGANHGHELTLTLGDVVGLLRSAHAAGKAGQEIQGSSPHSHALNFTTLGLVTLLIDGKLTLKSEEGAGHAHAVQISLSPAAEF